MIRKITISVLIVMLALASAFLLFFFSNHPASTLPPPCMDSYSATNPKTTIAGYPTWFNVSQGDNLAINLTLASVRNTEVSIPISLLLIHYNSTIDLNDYTFYFDDCSTLQKRAFNYSVGSNPLVLQPSEFNSTSTILTVNLAKDAPTGEYLIQIRMGTSSEGILTDEFRLAVYPMH